MMLAFVLIAGALATAAAVLMLLPLMRKREDASPAPVSAAAVLLLLLVGGAGLYAAVTKYSWVAAPSVAETPAAMTARLAQKLAKEPDNLDGWLMLGRSYFQLEQFPLAARAYQRADRLANGANVEALSGFAESLLAQNFEEIRGRAGRLFERVLELQPDNPKALLYGALAAMGRGEPAVARDRFTRMLAQNPPDNIRAIIQQQLRAIDELQATASSPDAGQGAGAGTAQIQVQVSVSPTLRYQLTPQAALFVLARDPAQPGPPFAAKRLPVRFPAEVTLTAADAMLPQRQISAGQKLEVVARISQSGQPQSSSGDLYGQVSYHVGQDGKLNIVIDKQAP